LHALQGKAHLRSAQPPSTTLLRKTGMPEGVRSREPEAMAGEAVGCGFDPRRVQFLAGIELSGASC